MRELSFTTTSITADVRRLYEAFPYPRYPLFARPLWQDGFFCSSKFSARLLEDLTGLESAINTARGQYVRNGRTVLVAGAGEILPYIVRKNESSQHRVLCVDLSSRSLRRAKLRLWSNLRPTEFIRSDINKFLEQQGAVSGPFDHIDLYGVLHHLADPAETLRLAAVNLAGNGTMRVMVYNREARFWIHQIQSVFRLLKLDPYRRSDLKTSKKLLKMMSDISPFLQKKFMAMGSQTLLNDARFVDTFFHPREAQISISRWFEVISQAGLTPLGLFDRYEELDDLSNPLWKMPPCEEIHSRAQSGFFGNNLELILYKKRAHPSRTHHYSYERKPDRLDVWTHYLCAPPTRWFQSEETKSISFVQRLKIWHRHFNAAYGIECRPIDALLKALPPATSKRLARLGAIFPGQVNDPQLRAMLTEPIEHGKIADEDFEDKANFGKSDVASFIEQTLKEKGIFTDERYELTIRRLNSSQMQRMQPAAFDATSLSAL